MNNLDPFLKLVVRNCFASTSHDPRDENQPRHMLLEENCPADPSMHVNHVTNDRFQFTEDAFSFHNDVSFVLCLVVWSVVIMYGLHTVKYLDSV